MFKRAISLILAAVCLACLLITPAFAEGKLKATEKNLILIPGDTIGYFYAKIENVGDAAVRVDSGDLVLFTDDDEILLSESYVTTAPAYVTLEPGEYLYLEETLWDSALEGAVLGDYKFSIGTESGSAPIVRVDAEARLELQGADSYENYLYVTFTNTTDETVFRFFVTVAMYDQEGNLIYTDFTILSDTAVHPGSTVTQRLAVDSDLMEYYAANGITPASAEAIVCYEVE